MPFVLMLYKNGCKGLTLAPCKTSETMYFFIIMKEISTNKRTADKHTSCNVIENYIELSKPEQVTNLNPGNAYKITFPCEGCSTKEFTVLATGQKSKVTWLEVEFSGKKKRFRDINKLQQFFTGKTNGKDGWNCPQTHKGTATIPTNGFIPNSRKEARDKAREWTANAIQKVAEAGKMFTLTEGEQETLKAVAIRYYRSKLSDLYERYETAAKEKAAKAEEKKLKTVDGQRERAERAEAELARAKAMLAELGVTL